MNWSMPRPVLQFVAIGLVVVCLGSFAVGAITAPARGRLPGEGPQGESAAVLEAQEAKPLTDERIVGATQDEEELTPEEKAKLEEEKKAKAEADHAADGRSHRQVAPEASAQLVHVDVDHHHRSEEHTSELQSR